MRRSPACVWTMCHHCHLQLCAQRAGPGGEESCCLMGQPSPHWCSCCCKVFELGDLISLKYCYWFLCLFPLQWLCMASLERKKKKRFLLFYPGHIHSPTNTVIGMRSNFSKDGTKLMSLSSISEIFVFSLSLPPPFYLINQGQIVWMHG